MENNTPSNAGTKHLVLKKREVESMRAIIKAAFVVLAITVTSAVSVTAGPLEDWLAAAKQGNYAAALQILRPLAEQGDANAQAILGLMYANGRGVAQDYTEAVKWYRKAANQGFSEEKFNLGFMYYNGDGVPQNLAEAAKWYGKAHDQMEAEAEEQIQLLRTAAEKGDAEVQFELGQKYLTGDGVPPDFDEAEKWFRMAADRGDVAKADQSFEEVLLQLLSRSLAEMIDTAGELYKLYQIYGPYWLSIAFLPFAIVIAGDLDMGWSITSVLWAIGVLKYIAV